MAASASFEKVSYSIEDIVAKMEEKLARRMESMMLQTASLAKQLAAVENVSNGLSEMQKQLATVATVGNELAGCISNELRDVQSKAGKLPKMTSQIETVKFCVQLIAQRLNVTEVQAALASRSPQVQQAAGAVPSLQRTPGYPAGGTTVQPQATEPHTPQARPRNALAKQSRSLSGKQKTPRGTGMHSSGRMDEYVLKTGQASK
jgi:uncharacterized protein YoxC